MGRLSKRELLTEKKTKSKKKTQTMKKKLFKTRLLSFAAFCGLALAFASCANEDVAQSTTGTETENDKNLTTFVAGDEAKTRTTMDYSTGAFYWEAGDKIYVKDDDGTWQVSNNSPAAKVAFFKFKVPGKFKNHTTYKVYYPGKNGNQDQVTISAAQSQAEPNNTEHFGESGDCGTADASKQSNGSFAFALDHQAAILVFQPYTGNTVLNDCYLTKIEVTSDNDITHTYTLDPTTGELTGTGSGKQIILTTKGSGAYTNGFPLKNTSASVATNGAYMVIKPGTHILKVRYWVKDIVTNVEGAITKTLSAFNYAKNTYYDMTANLDVPNYDGNHYCMWDAKKQYWDGYEWTHKNPLWQPTLNNQSSTFYPQNNTDPRYKNEAVGGSRLDASFFCASLPNLNEMVWYTLKGEPHWDDGRLWTTMGHLYKSGIWIKKKAFISGFSSVVGPDGVTDYRTVSSLFLSNPPSHTPLSDSEINQFFFLPTLGYLYDGKLKDLSVEGDYWSSSGNPLYNTEAGLIRFTNNSFDVYYYGRKFGFIGQNLFE